MESEGPAQAAVLYVLAVHKLVDTAHTVHHLEVPVQSARSVLHDFAVLHNPVDLVHIAHHTLIASLLDCPKRMLENQMAWCRFDVLVVPEVVIEADDMIRSAYVEVRLPKT